MSATAGHEGPNAKRKRALPAVRMPLPKEKRAGSATASVLFHVLVVFLLMWEMTPEPPPFDGIDLTNMKPMGNGIAGGGGGGRRGTGGSREYIKFVRPPTPQVQETLKPVEIKPPPPVPVPPPPPVPVPEPPKPDPVEPPKPAAVEPPKPVAVASVVDGSGGGSGRDGSRGNGPGMGGGSGSGIGTGTGSGVGPGTGGGGGTDSLMVYPPSPIELIVPPLPSPDALKGCEVVAILDIDIDGKVLAVNRSDKCRRNGNYDKRLEEMLKGTRFRPAVRVDGSPVRVKFSLSITF